MKKKNIFVFYGGDSVERDISVITAVQAMDNIDRLKYNVFPVYIYGDVFYYVGNYSDIQKYITFEKDKYNQVVILNDAAFLLKKNRLKPFCRKIDCALLCVHGGKYEGGALQGFLDMNGIPQTSCDAFASALCQSKRRLKEYLSGGNVSTIPSFTVKDIKDLKEISSAVNFSSSKYIVKPDSLGSSIGISVVSNQKELFNAVELALKYDVEVLVEKYLDRAKEYNCAVILSTQGYKASNVDRVVSAKRFLTFEEKYLSGGKYTGKENNKVDNDIPYAKEIKTLAAETARTIGAKGVVRCDFLVDEYGKIYLNEVNSVPGSLAYYLFDFDFKTLLDRLIENAVKTFNDKNEKIKCFSTSYLSKNISVKK